MKQSLKRQSYWRKKAIHALGGPTCVHCGCTVYSLLQINHIDGSGNLDRKKNGMVSGKFWRHIALGLREMFLTSKSYATCVISDITSKQYWGIRDLIYSICLEKKKKKKKFRAVFKFEVEFSQRGCTYRTLEIFRLDL